MLQSLDFHVIGKNTKSLRNSAALGATYPGFKGYMEDSE